MRKFKTLFPILVICLLLSACAQTPADSGAADYGRIKSNLSGLTQETAKAYLAAVDDFAAHLGYDETEAAQGECVHGGFVRDWDGDGTPELCLLLKTSPRDSDGWDGAPLYGWYPPTLYLFACQNEKAVHAGECDLYFATGGREAAVIAMPKENGMRLLRWDRSDLSQDCAAYGYELVNGSLQSTELPAEAEEALRQTETLPEFLDALGADAVQLLYNNSGEAQIEGEANLRELRAALADKAS